MPIKITRISMTKGTVTPITTGIMLSKKTRQQEITAPMIIIFKSVSTTFSFSHFRFRFRLWIKIKTGCPEGSRAGELSSCQIAGLLNTTVSFPLSTHSGDSQSQLWPGAVWCFTRSLLQESCSISAAGQVFVLNLLNLFI